MAILDGFPTPLVIAMATPFGIRLRRLREAKNLSLQQLAEVVGCTKAYLWELEMRDGQKPSAERVRALARELGVTMEALMEDQPSEMPGVGPKDYAFFREYAGMAEGEKERFRRALDVMFGTTTNADPKP